MSIDANPIVSPDIKPAIDRQKHVMKISNHQALDHIGSRILSCSESSLGNSSNVSDALAGDAIFCDSDKEYELTESTRKSEIIISFDTITLRL